MSQSLFQVDPSPLLPPCREGTRVPSTLHFYQQVKQLYALAPYGVVVSLVNGAILVGLLWTIVPQPFIAS